MNANTAHGHAVPNYTPSLIDNFMVSNYKHCWKCLNDYNIFY